MSNEVKRFILLGEAGAGKSTLINVLHNYFNGTLNPNEVFCENTQIRLAIPCKYWIDRLDKSFITSQSNERDINDMTVSQTMTCRTYSFKNASIRCEIIDTPGFNDTAGIEFDGNNLNHIEEALRSVPYLNGIIVVINGSIDRVGVAFKNFLHLLRQVWGNALFSACIAVLTNCDSSSVNLNPRLLYTELQISSDKILYFQNNVFRWNRQRKVTQQLHDDFKEAVESIRMLLLQIQHSPSVKTESFLVSPIKLGLLQNCIKATIENLLELAIATGSIQTTDDGISRTKVEMSRNTNRDFYHQIHAIAWEAMYVTPKKKAKYKRESKADNLSCNGNGHSMMRDSRGSQELPLTVETTSRSHCTHENRTENLHGSGDVSRDEYESRILYRPKYIKTELVVPDGESIARYGTAEQEHSALVEKKVGLYDKKQQLELSILSVLETLQQQVKEIRKINKNFNLLERNFEILEQFKSKTASTSRSGSMLHKCYLEIVNILS